MKLTLISAGMVMLGLILLVWQYCYKHKNSTCEDSVHYVDEDRKDFTCGKGTYLRNSTDDWLYCECLDHTHLDTHN